MGSEGIVLVTGASSGLGVSVAVQAARAGYTVYAGMRDLAKQQTLQDAADAEEVSLSVVQHDVRDAGQTERLIQTIVDSEGCIDCLVANAGIGYVRTTEQADETEIDAVMDTNFMGVVRCVKAALPHMRARRAGRFVVISSVGGLMGQPFNEFYCASKFAVEGYMESLASYVAPVFGLHFTLVEPGGIATEFASSILRNIKETGGFFEDEYKPLIERYIGGRSERNLDGVIQTPDEVARVVVECLGMDSPPVRTRTSPWSEEFSSLKTQADPDGKKAQSMVFETMMGPPGNGEN